MRNPPGYDSAHRLIGRNLSNGDKQRYTLDSAGRTIKTDTFDAQGQLTQSRNKRGQGRFFR
ncbi:MAG: hypothetical protein JNM52_11935 [Betaproteobacteria bacterium]|nr:hypothetical protein [Betaproteobacteria bacterium]